MAYDQLPIVFSWVLSGVWENNTATECVCVSFCIPYLVGPVFLSALSVPIGCLCICHCHKNCLCRWMCLDSAISVSLFLCLSFVFVCVRVCLYSIFGPHVLVRPVSCSVRMKLFPNCFSSPPPRPKPRAPSLKKPWNSYNTSHPLTKISTFHQNPRESSAGKSRDWYWQTFWLFWEE